MENKNNVDIRFYKPNDDEEIVKLLKKTFPKWEKNIDPLQLWRWKYIDSPQKFNIILAVINNKIVGCDHHKIFNAKIGSEVTTLSWGDDLAIDTNYRGQGIWPKISKYNHENSDTSAKYNYSTTTNPIVLKDEAKRNKKTLPFPVTRMVKIKDIDLHLRMRPMKNRLLVKYGYTFIKILNKLRNLSSSPVNQGDGFKIINIPKFDEGIDVFWEKVKDDYDFMLEKNRNFLNWRFSKPVRGNHIIIQAMKGEEILGYSVIGLREDGGYTEGRIEDLLALKNRLDVADALLDYTCKYFDDHDVNTIYYQVVEDHPYHGLSKRKGFIDSGSKPYISFNYSANYIKKTGETEIQFLKHTNPSRIYFNYADTV